VRAQERKPEGEAEGLDRTNVERIGEDLPKDLEVGSKR
jgi:hypothetical protein